MHLADTACAIAGASCRIGNLIVTIPNLLTLYRLAAAPVAAWMALAGLRDAFFVLILLSFLSDLVDGPIARWLDQRSRVGAKLDTIADAFTVLAGILGLLVLELDVLRSEIAWLYAFLGSYAMAAVFSFAKFGSLPAYHLYSSKAAAFCAGLFFVWYYLSGHSPTGFVLLACLGILANLESLLVTYLLKRSRTDVGSVFLVRADAGDRAE